MTLLHLIAEASDLIEVETPDQYRDRTGRCPRGFRFAQDQKRCMTAKSGGGGQTPSASKREPFEVSPEEVAAMDKAMAGLDALLGNNPPIYAYRRHLSPEEDDAFSELPKASQLLIAAGRTASDYFERDVVKNRKLHDHMCAEWAEDTDLPDSQRLQGALAALGVDGSPAPDDPDTTPERKEGADNQEMRAWIKQVQAYTQAFLKKHGIEEVTVYRGVKGQLEGVNKGDDVGISCREASSFSLDPKVAKKFADNVIAMKVPASRIFLTTATSHELNTLQEAEVVVLGASDLQGILV